MSKPLAKVTGDLDAPRGPDVEHRICVDPSWSGRAIVVNLPRNVHCAHCSGGGCDLCERAGAVSLRDRDEEPVPIRVCLPQLPAAPAEICVRVPGQGGYSQDLELGRGHLLLRVSVGETPSAGIVLASGTALSAREAERRMLMKRSLIMAGALILLFIGLLRLSGWL